jgi:Ca2+-binding RTX toxin-like protein
MSNSIVVGNSIDRKLGIAGADVCGSLTASNGHNVFGSFVTGAVPGDRANVTPASVFAAIDPTTGGGQLSSTGIVVLKSSLANPAVSAGDPITASATGQLGTTPRPQPADSLSDLGSVEIKQPLSTSATVNNDVITGSAAGNNLSGLAGNDLIKGLGGNDTLNGGPGSDVLDGGPGNNKLVGGGGVDLATFAFSPVAVVVDLSGTNDTAKRGGETDTLMGIQNAIGTAKNDTFRGDAGANEWQGGLGKDTATGGGGRDLYDFNAVADSPPGAGRDVVTDFVPGQDVIDLAGIDADTTIPGDQSFRWVGKATLTGAAQLGYYTTGGNTIVRASTDADAAAELEIQLTGKKTLTAADFVP